jgi:hypothetical protein
MMATFSLSHTSPNTGLTLSLSPPTSKNGSFFANSGVTALAFLSDPNKNEKSEKTKKRERGIACKDIGKAGLIRFGYEYLEMALDMR